MSTILLADAKDYLNITGSQYDTELQAVIDAAEAAIVKRVGPLTPTATTRRIYSGYGQTIVLPVLPAISLTSVTYVSGSPITLSDLYLDTASGVVSYNNSLTAFYAGWYDVVYQAGRSTLPADLSLAVKELVRHMWTTQRGSGSPRPGAAPSEPAPGSAYAMPMRVEQLLAPHQRYGFA